MYICVLEWGNHQRRDWPVEWRVHKAEGAEESFDSGERRAGRPERWCPGIQWGTTFTLVTKTGIKIYWDWKSDFGGL